MSFSLRLPVSPWLREELVASSPLVKGMSCWLRWSIGGWKVEEVPCAFVCSSEVLEVGFLDCCRLVCWFGWEGADGSVIGEEVAISSVMVRRISGTLVGEKLANAVSAGNDGRRLMTETSNAGSLSLQICKNLGGESDLNDFSICYGRKWWLIQSIADMAEL